MENKKLWFKAKRFGWGWRPVTWQGWLVTLAYVAGIIAIAEHSVVITASATGTTKTFLWNYIPTIIVLTAIMIWICYKTGEEPRWRWGEK
jgi:hypothetical protein